MRRSVPRVAVRVRTMENKSRDYDAFTDNRELNAAIKQAAAWRRLGHHDYAILHSALVDAYERMDWLERRIRCLEYDMAQRGESSPAKPAEVTEDVLGVGEPDVSPQTAK